MASMNAHYDEEEIDLGRIHLRRRAPPSETTGTTAADLAPITLEDLSLALSHRIGLPVEDAHHDANFVMDIFGFDDRVIDNVLEREDRQLFYTLEEEGMLSTDREENTLHDGREWRTHYWSLRKHVIRKYAEAHRNDQKRRRVASDDDVYQHLPSEAWATRRF